MRERTILVQRASDGYGGVKTTKTRSVHTVRLLAPLAADLRQSRLASGRPDYDTLIFPGIDGRTVTREAWKSWTRRTWADAWRTTHPVRVERPPRVYDLRHSYVSLLLAEGRTIHYVATQAGHDARLTLSTYGHLLAEYADGDRINAEREIVAARNVPTAGGPCWVSVSLFDRAEAEAGPIGAKETARDRARRCAVPPPRIGTEPDALL